MKSMLTIAGSDSCGGAGIQADLKTACAFGVYGMSAVTAITAQNTQQVRAVATLSPGVVVQQIEAVMDDISPDAVKIGMVANAEIANAVRRTIQARNNVPLVVDPVMVSKSGCRLIDDQAVQETILLMQSATIITPNLMEAGLLADMTINTREGMEAAAEKIRCLGIESVLIKGGALPNSADDLLMAGSKKTWLPGDKIVTRNTHGTGCSLSAAIACGLANGATLEAAVAEAKAYVTQAILDGPDLGNGVGPLGHMAQLYRNHPGFGRP